MWSHTKTNQKPRETNEFERRMAEMQDKHSQELQRERSQIAEKERHMEIERRNLHAHIASLQKELDLCKENLTVSKKELDLCKENLTVSQETTQHALGLIKLDKENLEATLSIHEVCSQAAMDEMKRRLDIAETNYQDAMDAMDEKDHQAAMAEISRRDG